MTRDEAYALMLDAKVISADSLELQLKAVSGEVIAVEHDSYYGQSQFHIRVYYKDVKIYSSRP